MKLWQILIKNHVLANLLFGLILLMGLLVYQGLPREQDPTVNFNWIQVTTIMPGASAQDMERKVTEVLEEVIEKVADIKFVSSTSRESVSSILVRFNDIGDEQFDQRLADLRREIQNVEDDLPDAAERPDIFEITTANAFPTATVVISSQSMDENLRRQAALLDKDLARIPGIDRVQDTGLENAQMQVQFLPEKMRLLGVTPVMLSQSIRAYYQDIAAGSSKISANQWIVSIEGTSDSVEQLANVPLLGLNSEAPVLIGDVATVTRGMGKPSRIVRVNGRPAILFSLMKREEVNTLKLVQKISDFVEQQKLTQDERGVKIELVDDQTEITRNALNIMQKNALYGLVFVLIVTWFFLGTRISLLVTIGIPFTLAGTFIALNLMGQTLNTSVLLGIVIALGMLVDDAVVVVESIYQRLRQGDLGFHAAWQGLQEVFAPVTASVLTTMAAFLPLMLLPGILGKFMLVIPLVVTTALAISLIEAYWMLPSHIIGAKINFSHSSKIQLIRERVLRKLKLYYGFVLIKVLRFRLTTLIILVGIMASSIVALQNGAVRVDFFAADTIRLFYVNVEMPPESSLQQTMKSSLEVEAIVKPHIQADELRSSVVYAGQMFTETEPLFGDQLGQIFVSLKPASHGSRSVEEIIDSIRDDLKEVKGPVNISFLKLTGGPPTSKAVSVKVRGNQYTELREATDALSQFLHEQGAFVDISDDDSKGRQGLLLSLDLEAVRKSGLLPTDIYRTVSMLVDGEIANVLRVDGEKVNIIVRSAHAEDNYQGVEQILQLALPLPTGGEIPLRSLLKLETRQIKGNIRHYNFRRTITLEADIDKLKTDTVSANKLIQEHWRSIASRYPNVSLDFTGELDDIQESIDSIAILFLFGLGLMYLILATQFQSFFQPLLILVSVPLAFTGVILGLWVTGYPLSLFTLYGVVALAGIAVNSAIVLISTANDNYDRGMSKLQATFYAARRRLLPIVITVMTTIGGLFSLAVGLGGRSLIWSPVAIAIVWGLFISAFLSLFAVPILYLLFGQRKEHSK
ncbi:MAG: efflux RND transporter permease subunit [bacterium]